MVSYLWNGLGGEFASEKVDHARVTLRIAEMIVARERLVNRCGESEDESQSDREPKMTYL